MRALLFAIGLSFSLQPLYAAKKVELGIDRLFQEHEALVKGKKIGLITNHTGVTSDLKWDIDLFREKEKSLGLTLKALFAPEHGLFGEGYAGQELAPLSYFEKIPVYGLWGQTRRPTKKMVEGIDLLVFDIQDIGCRSYTFQTTLFYVMEEAAKAKIGVIVCDRPNPINGEMVDGPMLENEWRSFVGYINVPYCHGMTIGELAKFFNEEYKVGCDLTVIPMKGWKRSMTFADTGLTWIPTSPNIPTAETAYFYPMTGLLGEFSFVSIGIGYTLPFRVVAAPWIDAKVLTDALKATKMPGLSCTETHIKPYFGSFKGKICHGTLLSVADNKAFLPVTTQFLIMSVLKNLYPKECQEVAKETAPKKDLFFKVCGTKAIYDLMLVEKPRLVQFCMIGAKEKEEFLQKRKKYLEPAYEAF